jgi:YbbR domain-containing protein
MQRTTQYSLRSNLAWLLASLVLALGVWVTASIQADPISQQTFNAVAVQLDVPEGLIVTNAPRLSVRVLVRAQRSVLTLLTAEDIVVTANLDGRTSGTHTIPLSVSVNRAGVLGADTQPTQITLSLEAIRAEQKPIKLVVNQPPPIDYTYEAPTASALQVAVSGALSHVESVAEVRGELDLSTARANFSGEVSLVALDSSGRRVTEVTLEPRVVSVEVSVYPRDDVRQLSVRPTLLLDTLQEDYVLSSISYEPQTVFVSGAKAELALLGATVETAPISLEGRTSSFSVDVPLLLPPNLLLLTEGNSVRVNIGITAQTTVRQLDNIPIEIIGLPASSTATLSPNTLSVVLSGPIAVLDALTERDIQAVVDLNNLRSGTQEVVPRVFVRRADVTLDSITSLPSAVTVTLVTPTPTPTTAP